MSGPPSKQRRESAFLQLPVYCRKQGGADSKFSKISSVWVGRGWTLSQIRDFLVESKDADGTSEQFRWLPSEFSFFHPDTEEEIPWEDEVTTLLKDFQKAFVAIQAKHVEVEAVAETDVVETEAKAKAETEAKHTATLRTGKQRKTRTESVASDVSVEANTLMFEVNSTFQDYPKKLSEFTQVLDAFGRQEITRPELKWAVEQLCADVSGGAAVLELFLEHLPDEDYELIMDTSDTSATSPTSTVMTSVGSERRDSSPSSKKKKRKSKSRKKSRSRSGSKDFGAREEKYPDRHSRRSSKNRSKQLKHGGGEEVRRIMSDPPRDNFFHEEISSDGSSAQPPSPTRVNRSSSVGDSRRPKSPLDERDVEISRRRGQDLLHDMICHGVVADVVSYTTCTGVAVFTVQVLAMDKAGQAMERWTVECVFHDFYVLDQRLRQYVESWHRPLSPMADEHHMITRLSPLILSQPVLEERMQYLSSYLREAVMCVQAAAVLNHTISAGARGSAARDAMLRGGDNVRNAGQMWELLATFLSVRKPNQTPVRYGGEKCCECENSCPCCRGCLSFSVLVGVLVLLPLMSSAVSLLYPAALGFGDERVKGTIISELRITWVVCVLRDALTFLILLVLALPVEGCKEGCGRLCTAGWTSPASPLVHVSTVAVLGGLFSGWQTMFLLGIQYVLPPTSDTTTTSLPDAKHHLFIASALCLVPLMYIFFSMFVGCRKDVITSIIGSGARQLSCLRTLVLLLGMVLVATIGIVNITTSFDLNAPCYANITTNASNIDETPSSSTSNYRVVPFTSTCLRIGFVLLCTSSACLALYIAILSSCVYRSPLRQFRPMTTSVWSAMFGSVMSIIVSLVGLSNVEGGIDSVLVGMPPLNDVLLYGVLPGVVASVGGYLMLAWMVLNTSGDVASSTYATCLVYSVIACAIGFKWEHAGTLKWQGGLFGGLSFLGVALVIGARATEWCRRPTKSVGKKDGPQKSLLRGDGLRVDHYGGI